MGSVRIAGEDCVKISLHRKEPPRFTDTPSPYGSQIATSGPNSALRNDKGDNEVHKEWALEGSNLRPSDYETVSNVVPDGQGADSDGISGPLRTGTDTGRHRGDSVGTVSALRPECVR
jgi:hypothetical protein